MEAVNDEPLMFPINRRPVTCWSDRSYPNNVSVISTNC